MNWCTLKTTLVFYFRLVRWPHNVLLTLFIQINPDMPTYGKIPWSVNKVLKGSSWRSAKRDARSIRPLTTGPRDNSSPLHKNSDNSSPRSLKDLLEPYPTWPSHVFWSYVLNPLSRGKPPKPPFRPLAPRPRPRWRLIGQAFSAKPNPTDPIKHHLDQGHIRGMFHFPE